VVVSDEYRPKMVKSRSPEPGVWKVNQRRWTCPRMMPTSDMLIEKYMRQRRKSVFQRLGGAREKGPLNGKSFTGDIPPSLDAPRIFNAIAVKVLVT
jgi:hypothetical protein